MNSREALAKILELLPELTDNGLKEVSNHIKARTQFSTISDSGTQEDYLLSGIFYETQRLGLVETIPVYFKIRNNSSFNSYGAKSERLRIMLDRHLPDLTLPEKLALGRLCARTLSEYVEKWRAIDFPTLLANIGYLPVALENDFPGYLRSGMLKHLIDCLTNPYRDQRGDAFDDLDC